LRCGYAHSTPKINISTIQRFSVKWRNSPYNLFSTNLFASVFLVRYACADVCIISTIRSRNPIFSVQYVFSCFSLSNPSYSFNNGRYPVSSRSTTFSVLIRALITDPEDPDRCIKFLWDPRATRKLMLSWRSLLGNSPLDQRTKYLFRKWLPVFIKFSGTSRTPTARRCKLICPVIPRFPWSLNSNLPRFRISAFSSLRFGHDRLPARAYKLNLNYSPFRPHHDEIAVRVISITTFSPTLTFSVRTIHILNSLPSSDLTPGYSLNFFSPPFITKLITFSYRSGCYHSVVSCISLFNCWPWMYFST